MSGTVAHTLFVTIGDGSNADLPMAADGSLTPEFWAAYKAEIYHAIKGAEGAEIVQFPSHHSRGSGDGQIGLWQGKREYAATYVALLHVSASHDCCCISGLKRRLLALKAEYGQDAIGFVLVDGEDHLL